MNKQEFRDAIAEKLAGLSKEDIDKAVAFYTEAVNDRMDEGMSEEEAVKDVGSPDEIANQILLDTPLPKLIKVQTSKKRELKGWQIALIIIGFPVWFPLLLAFICTFIAVYMGLWACVVGLYAALASLAVGGLAAIVFAILGLCSTAAGGFAAFGMGLALLGITLFLFFPVKWASIGLVKLIGAFVKLIKKIFIG